MADEKLIRLENLAEGLREKRIPERERATFLQGKLGSSVSYWSGLLAGDRSFGEKVARRIETGLDWPPGYLDSARGTSVEERALLTAFRALPPGDPVARSKAVAFLQGLAAAVDPDKGLESLPGFKGPKAPAPAAASAPAVAPAPGGDKQPGGTRPRRGAPAAR